VLTIAYRPVGLRRDGAAGHCPRRVEAGAPGQPAGLSLETGARGQTDAGRESTFTEEIGFRASLLNVDVNCALLSPGARAKLLEKRAAARYADHRASTWRSFTPSHW
jgi:hypothetical protein